MNTQVLFYYYKSLYLVDNVSETMFWERSGRRDNSLRKQNEGEVFHGGKENRKVRSAETFHPKDFIHGVQTASLLVLFI